MSEGWFDGLEPGDTERGAQRVREGERSAPVDWPTRAVEQGFASDEADYYDQLHEATVTAAQRAVRERETSDDRQLVHAVRSMDDCLRTANELRERASEWAGALGHDDLDAVTGSDPEEPGQRRLAALAERVTGLEAEAESLRDYIERAAPSVAPNLSALAGPVLAARLVSLAGGLEPLAKKPSGTLQVLGAEDALFAHLQGGAPSPKHGVIYTHEYVRGTDPGERGSAARALAGKLSIAARIDHYSGDYRPELEAELDDRIERIRARDSS